VGLADIVTERSGIVRPLRSSRLLTGDGEGGASKSDRSLGTTLLFDRSCGALNGVSMTRNMLLAPRPGD